MNDLQTKEQFIKALKSAQGKIDAQAEEISALKEITKAQAKEIEALKPKPTKGEEAGEWW